MENFWAGTISAVAGVVVGGGVTWLLELSKFKRNRAVQQQIAAMQIASLLDYWLNDIYQVFANRQIDQEPDDYDPDRDAFPLPWHIPDFPLKNSLAVISLLKSESAKKLFDVIAKLQNAEFSAHFTMNVQRPEDAENEFKRELGNIYFECQNVYEDLARQTGWTTQSSRENRTEFMRERLGRAD
ncbi:MAG: hypothetical protein ACOY15_09820 [Pseudomonadota bacterium]